MFAGNPNFAEIPRPAGLLKLLSQRTRRPLQSSPVPLSQVRRGFIGGLQESQQHFFRLVSPAYNLVRQNEFAHLRTVKCLFGKDWRFFQAGWLRVGIGIEGRFGNCSAAGPEPAAAHFMGIGFSHHEVSESRHAARVLGRSLPKNG